MFDDLTSPQRTAPSPIPIPETLQHFHQLRVSWRVSSESTHQQRLISINAFQDALKKRFMPELTEAAIYHLQKSQPQYSAASALSKSQLAVFCAAAPTLFCLAATFPITFLITLNIALITYYVSALAFRIKLAGAGASHFTVIKHRPRPCDDKLPVITILLPLYHDAESLALLSKNIDAIDYPAEKKDVKLLLEEDDRETLAEATRLGLHERYDLIKIPAAGPRTKPKACNFGLYLARGDLIVIYDAEDYPERDQLKKAAAAFHHAGPRLACLQARLNYYNHSENWLTRMFSLEYALWFDWMLPGLEIMRAPIPLGGTSNFFRTDILMRLGGWDPFNVTEDADLGMRLSKAGYCVKVLNSTTYEEANCRLGNWIRQRSRWIKGHLQTWLVHMRTPGGFIRTTGWRGFLAVQLFVGGNVFGALINPILWIASLIWILPPAFGADEPFPPALASINFITLSFGNLSFIALASIAPAKRGWLHLAPVALTAPVYWLLTSAAAYKALWQIFTRPHYWEKTDHMISIEAQARRAQSVGAG